MDGYYATMQSHVTLLNLCQAAGFSDYRFCFHASLPIAGNCRLCLVELEEFDKQIAACVTQLESSYAMWTYSAFSKKARENVVENLLVNHPIDCPICDQGGECDLQDQVKSVGGHRSRFSLKKREVSDKRSGFKIKTIMTRCIHCLRCVRFNKLSGPRFFGVLNRTKKSEIVYHSLDSAIFDFSGMTLELCPVGALTAREYAFKYRPWELITIGSVDFTDSVGSNIYVSFKEAELVRICAKANSSLNGNNIRDTIRYSFDGNSVNRLSYSYFFDTSKKVYEHCSWSFFFETFNPIVAAESVCCLVNDDIELNSLFYLKTLTYRSSQTIKMFTIQKKVKQNNFFSNHFSSLKSLETINTVCVLLGINPKIECSLLNFKFRLKYKQLLFNLFFLGRAVDSPNFFSLLGNTVKDIITCFSGKLGLLSNELNGLYLPLLLFGESFFRNIIKSESIFSRIFKKLKSYKFFKLHLKSNSFSLQLSNIFSIGKLKSKHHYIFFDIEDTLSFRKQFVYNFPDMTKLTSFKLKKFIWYNFIIPVGTLLENENYFINVEHRLQKNDNFNSSVKSMLNIIKALFNINLANGVFGFLCMNFVNEFLFNYNIFFSFTIVLFIIVQGRLQQNISSLSLVTTKSSIEFFSTNKILQNSFNYFQNKWWLEKRLINFWVRG